MHPFDDRSPACVKSDFGEAWWLSLWGIGDGKRFKSQVRAAFLVIFGKEKANGQGEKVNSEENK